MWELIAVNKRNSIILMAAMAAVLATLGYIIGVALAGPQAGLAGVVIAAGLWLVLALVSFSQGDKILLASSGAAKAAAEAYPVLFNVVEEMTLAAGLAKMPDVYVIPDESPNAFATGRNPQNASVAVTAGLLARLDRDQLQGVIAHEISHVIHRDILFVTLAGVMLGTIALLSDVFLRSLRYGSAGGGRRYSGRSSRKSSGIVIVVAIIAAILAPLLTQILYFALSRRREYLADAGAVRLTRYPEGLAGALEKIAQYTAMPMRANRITAPMYIASPFRTAGAAGLFSTHPPTEQRIKILRSIAGAAGPGNYDAAYRQITHENSIMPPSGLAEKNPPQIRQPHKQEPQQTPQQQRRRGLDIIRKIGGFAFINCSCGVKLKIPPTLKTNRAACPRCGTIHTLKKGDAE